MRPITETDLQRMETLDRMEVTGITTWAYHGVFDHERTDGQPFTVDLTWWSDMGVAASTDNLENTANYAEVSNCVIQQLSGTPVDLIETLAYQIIERLFEQFGFEYVRLSLHKPQAPLEVEFTDVVLTVTGGRYELSHPPAKVTTETVHSQGVTIHTVPLSHECGTVGHLPSVTVTATSRTCVFSLGSNIEPCGEFLQFAVSALASTPGIRAVRVSSVYQTTPQSEVAQPDFLNAVLIAESALDPLALLNRAQEIEEICGRTREISHGSRTLDIDLITLGNGQYATKRLTIPHPRATNRGFVLIPWLEVDPEAKLAGVPIKHLVNVVRDQGVRLVDSTLFLPPTLATNIGDEP
ncbi:MAG: 2-amino-4-hydroxy-6-hydroxymethyldihydropteridine diphosphokinase [Propionibacteriaceae bacterium]|nr:2-amino-4-hydroxy-6-hydroxymethyldihydropteridine diphosphokinase [Propionibacteriaceae bacterium]